MNTTKELQIAATLKRLGIPSSLKGYTYLKYALNSEHLCPECIYGHIGSLYVATGKKFGVSYTNVERCIRQAISTGCLRGDVEFYNEIFGWSIDSNKGKPTNGEFIAAVREYIDSICQGEDNGN